MPCFAASPLLALSLSKGPLPLTLPPNLIGPVDHALLPDVDQPGDERDHEDPHGDEPGPAQACVALRVREEQHRPRVEEDGLDVEDDEEERYDVELDAEPLARGAHGVRPAL